MARPWVHDEKSPSVGVNQDYDRGTILGSKLACRWVDSDGDASQR